MFMRFGTCQLDMKKGFAFVDFAKENDAEAALRALDGATIEGQRIHVEWSRRHRAETAKSLRRSRERKTEDNDTGTARQDIREGVESPRKTLRGSSRRSSDDSDHYDMLERISVDIDDDYSQPRDSRSSKGPREREDDYVQDIDDKDDHPRGRRYGGRTTEDYSPNRDTGQYSDESGQWSRVASGRPSRKSRRREDTLVDDVGTEYVREGYSSLEIPEERSRAVSKKERKKANYRYNSRDARSKDRERFSASLQEPFDEEGDREHGHVFENRAARNPSQSSIYDDHRSKRRGKYYDDVGDEDLDVRDHENASEARHSRTHDGREVEADLEEPEEASNRRKRGHRRRIGSKDDMDYMDDRTDEYEGSGYGSRLDMPQRKESDKHRKRRGNEEELGDDRERSYDRKREKYVESRPAKYDNQYPDRRHDGRSSGYDVAADDVREDKRASERRGSVDERLDERFEDYDSKRSGKRRHENYGSYDDRYASKRDRYGDRSIDRYDDRYYGRQDDRYRDRYHDRYHDRYGPRYGDRYDERYRRYGGRSDSRYDDLYDERMDYEVDDERYRRRSRDRYRDAHDDRHDKRYDRARIEEKPYSYDRVSLEYERNLDRSSRAHGRMPDRYERMDDLRRSNLDGNSHRYRDDINLPRGQSPSKELVGKGSGRSRGSRDRRARDKKRRRERKAREAERARKKRAKISEDQVAQIDGNKHRYVEHESPGPEDQSRLSDKDLREEAEVERRSCSSADRSVSDQDADEHKHPLSRDRVNREASPVDDINHGENNSSIESGLQDQNREYHDENRRIRDVSERTISTERGLEIRDRDASAHEEHSAGFSSAETKPVKLDTGDKSDTDDIVDSRISLRSPADSRIETVGGIEHRSGNAVEGVKGESVPRAELDDEDQRTDDFEHGLQITRDEMRDVEEPQHTHDDWNGSSGIPGLTNSEEDAPKVETANPSAEQNLLENDEYGRSLGEHVSVENHAEHRNDNDEPSTQEQENAAEVNRAAAQKVEEDSADLKDRHGHEKESDSVVSNEQDTDSKGS